MMLYWRFKSDKPGPVSCSCWIGRGDFGGMSAEREQCAVHGIAPRSDIYDKCADGSVMTTVYKLYNPIYGSSYKIVVLNFPATNEEVETMVNSAAKRFGLTGGEYKVIEVMYS